MGFRFSFIILLLLGMTGFFQKASADILAIRQDLVATGTSNHVEVTTFMAETDADRQTVLERIAKSLAEDSGRNPNLAVGFEEVFEEKKRSPSAMQNPVHAALEKIALNRPILRRAVPEKLRRQLHLKYPEWFLEKSRWVFSISRGTVNASIATWSLMVSQHLPFEVALAAGTLTGTMSGAFMFANEKVQAYLTTSIAEKWVKANQIREGVKTVEGLFRWYLLEVGFVTTIQTALAIMGHPPAGSLSHDLGSMLGTAGWAVAAQGGWDYTIGKVTRQNLDLAKTIRAKKLVRLRADFITLGLSALAVTGTVGKLAGLSFGNTVFIAMGTTGTFYLGKVLYSDWKCQQLLKPKLSELPNPLTAPEGGSSEVEATSLAEHPFQRFAVQFALPM